MTAYYNEIDPYAAQWLRNLIAAGHIAPGEVDERSILDVSPDDLAGFTQCHFFAGIGVWSHALRRGGWPDSRPVWTGSCPCQPFSMAGMGGGFDDERHLWPFWFHLIEQCRPAVVFGEQVEAAIRHGWLDLVQADLEGIGYAFAAAGIPAAGVGAPHIRQRLWFVADAESPRWGVRHTHDQRATDGEKYTPRNYCKTDRLADSASNRRVGDGKGSTIQTGRNSGPEQSGFMAGGFEGRPVFSISEAPGMAIEPVDDTNDARLEGLGRGHQATGGRFDALRSVAEAGEPCGLAHCHDAGSQGRIQGGENERRQDQSGHAGCGGSTGDARETNGFWRDADWLFCRDGKWRPVEPGTFPLAHGAPARVGRLRAYGNAIVSEVAREFVAAYLECRP